MKVLFQKSGNTFVDTLKKSYKNILSNFENFYNYTESFFKSFFESIYKSF